MTTTESLNIVDRLLNEIGEEISVASIEWVNKGIRVHNLDVMNPDTFIAGGVLVHNKSPLPTE